MIRDEQSARRRRSNFSLRSFPQPTASADVRAAAGAPPSARARRSLPVFTNRSLASAKRTPGLRLTWAPRSMSASLAATRPQRRFGGACECRTRALAGSRRDQRADLERIVDAAALIELGRRLLDSIEVPAVVLP